MSELEEVRASGKMSERILENNFRIFDHRLREMEGELKLCPYATLSEVIAWAEQLKITIGKIKLIQESSIVKSKKECVPILSIFLTLRKAINCPRTFPFTHNIFCGLINISFFN